MGWFSSLFSSQDSTQRSRSKGHALDSTHEAFSTHPDAFSPDGLHTPEQQYTYPPKGQYGYLPSPLTASRPGSSTLLPTHMDPGHSPLSPRSQYPPLEITWNRLRVWLNREYPELGDTLNYGIPPQDLADIELQLGLILPSAVRESYLCVDGQEAESAAGCAEGLFFGLTLLPLESVLEEWRFWREVDDDPTTGANPRLLELMQSIPPGYIRLQYSNRGWLPLIADKAGNYIGVDMNPAENGAIGQVIIFGRDFDTKVVLWNGDGYGGWGKWLAAFVDELESGDGFEIGGGENSEGSEDDVGYESYYHDGSGRGAGDGGGDSGAAGLRLTGEYRGWSVLEAFGDRSLRKWHEAGLLPDFSYQTEPTEPITQEPIGLGVMDLTHDNGAEVPIPVISEPEGAEQQQQPVASSSKHTHGRSRSAVAPPAPRPVDLPTQSDLDPTLPPEASADYDLEAGRGVVPGRQFQEEDEVRPSRGPISPLLREPDVSTSAIPFSPPPPLDTNVAKFSQNQATSATPTNSTPAVLVPDILTESPPVIAAVPIQPSTSTQAQPKPEATPDLLGSSTSVDNVKLIDDEDSEDDDEEEDSDEEETEEEEEKAEEKGKKEEVKEVKKEESEEESEEDSDEDSEEESEEESEASSSGPQTTTSEPATAPTVNGDATTKTHQANSSSVSTVKLVPQRKESAAAV